MPEDPARAGKEHDWDDAALTHRGTVFSWECDMNGHMNVQFYVARFDQASWQMTTRFGFNRDFIESSGTNIMAVRQEIDYRHELMAADNISVYTDVTALTDKSITLRHRMVNDATRELSAEMLLVGLYVDLKRRKAIPFPKDMAAEIKQSLVAS
jgi:acyl-CoA thioester hydrolase